MYFYFTFSEDKIAEKISWMKKIVAEMVYNVNLFPFLFSFLYRTKLIISQLATVDISRSRNEKDYSSTDETLRMKRK